MHWWPVPTALHREEDLEYLVESLCAALADLGYREGRRARIQGYLQPLEREGYRAASGL